jgi:hypothetical protein
MSRKEGGPAALRLLVAHGQVQQVFSAVRGDAPGHEHRLLGPLGPKRLEDRVAEQVLDLDLGQVAGDEGLVVLPQPIGDLRDRALGDQQLAGRVSEGVLDVARGKPRAYISVTNRSRTSELP